MLLELQEPFKSLWNKGYLQIHADGRKYVCLFNSNQNRTIISYARYLMCVKLGYVLSNEFEVDHIDDDKTNDDINNLQVLTSEQNLLKQHYNFVMNQQVVYGVYCAYCGTPFLLIEREVKNRIAKKVEVPFCGRSCAVKFNHYNKSK